MVQWLRLQAPTRRAPGFDLRSGNKRRSHMLQEREPPAVTKILPAATKTKDPKCQT